MNFIGHNSIRSEFKNSIKNNALSHAHLIVGEAGIGKKLLAKELALSILGQGKNKNYVDIVNYKVEKSSFGVDDIREVIKEANKKPCEGDKKVIILNDGNKITVQAQNAFLKTIEEPPKGVYIIIICESSELILDTIKSRCQIHKLFPLSINEMKEFIKLNFSNLNLDYVNTLLSISQGIPGKVESFLKEKSFMEIRNICLNLLNDINDLDGKIIIKYENVLLELKEKFNLFLNDLVSFVRDIIVFKEVKNTVLIINIDKINEIKELSNIMSYKKLKNIIKIVDETRICINSNTNLVLTVDAMLIRLLED